MITWITNNLLWITNNLLWTEGQFILIITSLIAAIGVSVWRPLLWVAISFLLFSFYFFRNPTRVCQEAFNDKAIIVCPADGRIVDVQYDKYSSLEGEYAYKVSIFLSALDVHVNWIPIAGTVVSKKYTPGAFKFAFLPKSSELNERNDIIIKDKSGKTILVRQIAGLIARRICCWTNEGDLLTIGQKYGMIRFGSRVDIFLPRNIHLEVEKGQYVYGGQTVLGRWICH